MESTRGSETLKWQKEELNKHFRGGIWETDFIPKGLLMEGKILLMFWCFYGHLHAYKLLIVSIMVFNKG